MAQEQEAAKPCMIAVMGATGTGKSTFINLVSGSKLPVGDGLGSCTDKVDVSQPFALGDRQVTLIDTPGFDDAHRSDTEILESISEYLAKIYGQGTTLAGVLYLHRISDIRMGGASRRNFRLFRSICGTDTLTRVRIVTTMWSALVDDPAIGERRERELASSEELFKPVLDEGAQMVRHDGSVACAREILARLVSRDSEETEEDARPLLVVRELVDEGKDLAGTSAGTELANQLNERIRRLEGEISKLRQEIRQTRENDAKTKNELLVDLMKTEEEKKRKEEDAKRLEGEGVAGLMLMLAALQMAAALHNQVDDLKEKAKDQERQKQKEVQVQSSRWFSWWK